MKIAFVGKGGSGKSTLTSLFVKYLLRRDQTILAIDADINVHLGELLGLPIDSEKALSLDKNTNAIRSYLKGENPRIATPGHFVKTTPPGRGSRFLRVEPENLIVSTYSTPLDGDSSRFMYVGTYGEDGIGVSCYHTNLSVLENLLSHAVLEHGQWIVCDMVAGTDAFSNTLHAQFDTIFLVVEPTPEGVKVFEQYRDLAQSAGVYDSLSVIGNKVEDEDDLSYLRNIVASKLIAHVPLNKHLRKARQNNQLPQLEDMSNPGVFENIFNHALSRRRNPQAGLMLLHKLHKSYAKQDYIVNVLGDVTDQIDPDFSYEQTNVAFNS